MANILDGGVKQERAKKLHFLKRNTRVRTPQGDGAYQYSEDGKQAVVHLDKRYKDDATGMTVSDIYCAVEEMEVL